jgi:hypothetical protein
MRPQSGGGPDLDVSMAAALRANVPCPSHFTRFGLTPRCYRGLCDRRAQFWPTPAPNGHPEKQRFDRSAVNRAVRNALKRRKKGVGCAGEVGVIFAVHVSPKGSPVGLPFFVRATETFFKSRDCLRGGQTARWGVTRPGARRASTAETRLERSEPPRPAVARLYLLG